MFNKTNNSGDVYTKITNQIISAIEAGTEQYKMPWHMIGSKISAPINIVTKKVYRGINVLALWAIAAERGYTNGVWATYDQWKGLGAQVRRGEKGSMVVFWKTLDSQSEDQEEKPSRRPPIARLYYVFNIDQVDGYHLSDGPQLSELERIEHAELYFNTIGINPIHGGNRSYYQPTTDEIHLPKYTQFKSGIDYYSWLGHETIHFSGHESRCNRDLSGRFGSLSYAAEELIAEMGAAFLCAQLGLSNEPRTDHAAYINSWLQLLKSDKKALFTAASKAQEAVDWLNNQASKAAVQTAA